MPVEPEISYPVRELLEEIRTAQTEGFATVVTKLDSKADKADVERLRSEVSEHRRETDTRLRKLEQDDRDTKIAERARDEQEKEQKLLRRGRTQFITTLVSVAAGATLALIALLHVI